MDNDQTTEIMVSNLKSKYSKNEYLKFSPEKKIHYYCIEHLNTEVFEICLQKQFDGLSKSSSILMEIQFYEISVITNFKQKSPYLWNLTMRLYQMLAIASFSNK